MQPYRELGNELDKNYDDIVDLNGKQWFKWHHNRKIFGHPLFCCGVWEGLSSCGLAREGWKEDWLEWLNNPFFPPLGGGFFLYLGNSVFVDPIRGPNKTLSKNNNKIVDRFPTPIGCSVPKP
jgi:hypothetical protein